MKSVGLRPRDVLYRDDVLLVINKPAGMPVHGSPMLEGRPTTILSAVRALTGRLVHPVHRIDRPVSGALLLALDRNTLAALADAFAQRAVDKRYLAVVRGWSSESGVVDHPLLPPRDEREPGSKPRDAITQYRRLARMEVPVAVPPYETARYSLLALTPETGRRHQLRRHMKHISHHVVGDTTYGKGEHNRLFRSRFHCGRLLLHSRLLGFDHPAGGRVEVSAPLDEAFSRVANAFDWPSGVRSD